MMAKPVVSNLASAVVGRSLELPMDADKGASRSCSRSTSIGSSPGSDLPSIATSPDCSPAQPFGPLGLLNPQQYSEAISSFNFPAFGQHSPLDKYTNELKASVLGICPPPGLEDLSLGTDESSENTDGDDEDDNLAWVVASSAAEMALETPVSSKGKPRLSSLSALEADMENLDLLRAPRAPAFPPPPPLQPPVLNCTRKSPQFSPPQQAPILATDVRRPSSIVPPPSWSPLKLLEAERCHIVSPPMQPPLLTAPMTLKPVVPPPSQPPVLADSQPPLLSSVSAQPVAPPPMQAPVLGAEVLAPVVVPPPVKAPVLRLAEALSSDDSQAPALPTVGSAGHHTGACKPCAFLHTKGCSNGVQCSFCHLCGPGEKKRRMKERRAVLREA